MYPVLCEALTPFASTRYQGSATRCNERQTGYTQGSAELFVAHADSVVGLYIVNCADTQIFEPIFIPHGIQIYIKLINSHVLHDIE